MFQLNKQLEVFTIIVIFLFFYSFFKNNNTQDPLWLVPYLSGAKNLSEDGVWRYSETELEEIKNSNDPSLIYSYDFKKYPKEDLKPNIYNSVGYLYIVKVSSVIFFWLPSLKATYYFQLFIHLVISLLVYFLINDRFSKLFFLGLYLFNPFIIYLATFPFYYFYQVIPTFFIFLLYKKKMKPIVLFSMFGLLGFMVNVRMTLLFATFIATLLLLKNYNLKHSLFSIFIMTISFICSHNSSTINSRWHTTYIGIGAYPNKYLEELSDESGVILYESKTDQKILPMTERSYKYIKDYNEICKKEYYKILRESPFLLVKNSVLNILQSYSLGHFSNRGRGINLFSIFIGFLIIILLTLKKKYWYIWVIGFLSISFTPYFPPIQQYMFGSYLLIVISLIECYKPIKI